MTGRSTRQARLLAVLALLALAGAACSRDNPAFRGAGDGGSAQHDGGTSSDAVTPADGAVGPDAGCKPGAACTAEGNRCQIGTMACGDVARCESLTPALNGTPCAVDKVCKEGSCIDCAAGSACDPGVECKAGRLDCSFATGEIACLLTGAAPDGTTCTGGVCYRGACNSATCWSGGTVCDYGMICDRNGCGADQVGVCVAKDQSCTDEVAPVCGCDGVTYTNDCMRRVANVALDHPGACINARENCMNGVDDNGDGAIDCDDPQCAVSHTCVEALPTGWTGLGWIDPESTALSCSAGLTAQALHTTLVAPTLGCSCTCGSPATHCGIDLICSPGYADCLTGATTTTVYSTCGGLTLPQGTSGCKAEVPEIRGSCPPFTNTTRPPVSWGTSGQGCMATALGSCSTAGQVCAPLPPAGALGPCIGRAGDYSCPLTGTYTVKRLFYTGAFVDSRTCTACTACEVTGSCTCNNLGQMCGVSIYAGASCGGSPQDVNARDASGACTPVSMSSLSEASAQMVGVVGPDGVQCWPGTSSSTGSISPGPKITVCCAQ